MNRKLFPLIALCVGAGQLSACVSGKDPTSARHIRGVVLPFERTSCPAGWDQYVQGAGRVIVGVNPGQGGDHGANGLPAYELAKDYGSPTVTVTKEQMPIHSHGHGDIYYSEHGITGQAGFGSNAQGQLSVPNNWGSARTDVDNAGAQILRKTGEEGGGKPIPIQIPARALLFCKLL
jgi:hypothetical protein